MSPCRSAVMVVRGNLTPFILFIAATGSEPRLRSSSALENFGETGAVLRDGLNNNRGLCGEPGALFETKSSVGDSSVGFNRRFNMGEFGPLLVRTRACFILLICRLDADELRTFPRA